MIPTVDPTNWSQSTQFPCLTLNALNSDKKTCGHPPSLVIVPVLASTGVLESSGRRGRSPHSHRVVSSSERMDWSTVPCLCRSTSVSLLGEGGRVLEGLKQQEHYMFTQKTLQFFDCKPIYNKHPFLSCMLH